MALNVEAMHPVAHEEHDLPSHSSYLEAVPEAEANDIDEDEEGSTLIDEASIKETPPRPQHARQSSEPRPLGEVMDEAEEGRVSPMLSSSPSLRHPKGRLEEKQHIWEKYGAEDRLRGLNGYVNGSGGERRKHHRVNGTTGGDRTPESFEAVGMDEEPRSPVRRAHRKTSSKSLTSSPATTTKEEGSPLPGSSPRSLHVDSAREGTNGQGSALIYDNLTNKSGENLASLKQSPNYYSSLSLSHLEDKPPTTSSPTLVSGRRAGAGWSRSAIRWAPFHIPLQRRLQTLIVLLHTLSVAGLLALFFTLCTIPLLWPILLPYLVYALLSRSAIDGRLSKRSEWARRSKIWSLFASYFPARLHRTQKLEPGRKYIFGYHPHGIISHGAFAAFATEALGFGQLFPGITNTLLTLDSNFRIPLYRDYILRMGLASVSRESCENILSRGGTNGEGMGRAITIVVGGARESLDAKPGSLRLVLKRRKGFVKLAVRMGADLVPVLGFGENDIYDQLDTERRPWVRRAQSFIKKAMGFTVPLFHARGVFNYDVGLMPYRRPINVVVGRPVQIMQSATPDPAYVDEIHARYVEELVRVWEEWKDTFARGRGGELEIVE